MSLPKIPAIKFVAKKQGETEEFISYADLEDWIIDTCDRSLYDFYRFDLCSDERRGTDGYRDYAKQIMSKDELISFVEDIGWSVERVLI